MEDASVQKTPDEPAPRAGSQEGAIPVDDGVDVTLIRWMLSLSPTQRLEVLQNTADSLTELCDAATKGKAGRARDLAVLPILERTLAERHG